RCGWTARVADTRWRSETWSAADHMRSASRSSGSARPRAFTSGSQTSWVGAGPWFPKSRLLKELRVRDLALVAESNVRFGPGLNLLTGETGSGKSLIIDALSLALGARGGADQVRHGAERASIEADFDLVVLQREIGKRGAARVDGRPATPAQLREVGTNLVAIHGQHAHQALLDGDTQTELLDAYAAALEVRAAVATAHAAWVAAVSSLRDLDQLRSLAEEMADVAATMRRYLELLDSDPNRLEEIESRLAVLDGIKRKYGGSIESAIQDRDRLELQLGATEDLDSAVATAEATRDRRRADLEAAATHLTKARTSAGRRMEKAVAAELQGLRLEGARFEVVLVKSPDIGPAGAE